MLNDFPLRLPFFTLAPMTTFPLRHLKRLVLLTAMSSLAASAANLPVRVHVVNHTGQEYRYALQDATGKPVALDRELFGGYRADDSACCYALPATWQPGIKLKLIASAVHPMELANTTLPAQVSSVAEIARYPGRQASDLWLIHDSGGALQLVASDVAPDDAQWPGKVKGWPTAAQDDVTGIYSGFSIDSGVEMPALKIDKVDDGYVMQLPQPDAHAWGFGVDAKAFPSDYNFGETTGWEHDPGVVIVGSEESGAWLVKVPRRPQRNIHTPATGYYFFSKVFGAVEVSRRPLGVQPSQPAPRQRLADASLVRLEVRALNYSARQLTSLGVTALDNPRNSASTDPLLPYAEAYATSHFTLPRQWRAGLAVQVAYRLYPDSTVRQARVEIPRYPASAGKPGALWLIVGADEKIEIVVAGYKDGAELAYPGDEEWPGKLKEFPQPPLAYRQQVWAGQIQEKKAALLDARTLLKLPNNSASDRDYLQNTIIAHSKLIDSMENNPPR